MIFIWISVYLILGLAALKIMNNLLVWCGYHEDHYYIIRPISHNGLYRRYSSFLLLWSLWPMWFPVQFWGCLASALVHVKSRVYIRDLFDRVFEFFDKIVR